MKRLWLGVAVVGAIAACSERSTEPLMISPSRALLSAVPNLADDTAEYRITPNGLYHKSCIFEVPSGGKVVKGGVQSQDGRLRLFSSCKQPGPVASTTSGLSSFGAIGAFGRPGGPSIVIASGAFGTNPFGAGRAGNPAGTDSNARAEWWPKAGSTNVNGLYYRRISARWVVPQVPASSYTSVNQATYLFPGLMSANEATVLQPVLGYLWNTTTNSYHWGMVPYMCGPRCVPGTTIPVNVGDIIGGTVAGTSCSAGLCDWTITINDSTTGASSTLFEPAGALLDGETDDTYSEAIGGALEIWNLPTCSYISGGPHLFSQIATTNASGGSYAGPWFPSTRGTGSPASCGYGMTTSSVTNLTITDSLAPVLTANILGPGFVQSGVGGEWSATVGLPGTPPYTYSWGGILGGSSSSVSGTPTASGNLTLRVIDAAGDTANVQRFIKVCTPPQLTC